MNKSGVLKHAALAVTVVLRERERYQQTLNSVVGPAEQLR